MIASGCIAGFPDRHWFANEGGQFLRSESKIIMQHSILFRFSDVFVTIIVGMTGGARSCQTMPVWNGTTTNELLLGKGIIFVNRAFMHFFWLLLIQMMQYIDMMTTTSTVLDAGRAAQQCRQCTVAAGAATQQCRRCSSCWWSCRRCATEEILSRVCQCCWRELGTPVQAITCNYIQLHACNSV